MALQKKKMVKEGKLGKHGEKIDGVTPAEWNRDYVDYNREVCEISVAKDSSRVLTIFVFFSNPVLPQLPLHLPQL